MNYLRRNILHNLMKYLTFICDTCNNINFIKTWTFTFQWHSQQDQKVCHTLGDCICIMLAFFSFLRIYLVAPVSLIYSLKLKT